MHSAGPVYFICLFVTGQIARPKLVLGASSHLPQSCPAVRPLPDVEHTSKERCNCRVCILVTLSKVSLDVSGLFWLVFFFFLSSLLNFNIFQAVPSHCKRTVKTKTFGQFFLRGWILLSRQYIVEEECISEHKWWLLCSLCCSFLFVVSLSNEQSHHFFFKIKFGDTSSSYY